MPIPIPMPIDFNSIDFNDILSNIVFEKRKNKSDKKKKEKDKDLDVNDKKFNSIKDIGIDIRCNECKSININELNGYYVCQDCGLYNDCIIDSGQEWRFYGADDSKGNDPARCDIPTSDLLPKTSIGALVGYSSRENKTSKRIRNMNSWNAIPYRESSLLETFNNITIMSLNSGINQCIIEEAKYMYKKVTDIKSSRRTKKEAMKAGSIMLACKLKGVPRNCSEISRIFKLKNNKTFRKSIKTFEEIWNNIQMIENGITQTIKTQSIDFDTYDSDESNSDESNSDDDDDTNTNYSVNYINENDIKYAQSKIDVKQNTNFIFDNTNIIVDKIKVDKIKVDKIKVDKISYNDNVLYSEKTKDNTDFIIKSKSLEDCITKLHRFSCILGFDDKTYEACKLILTYVEQNKYLEKHTPLSRTSAIIYYIIERLNISINKHEILQICEISEVTINKCYQKLIKYKAELIKINVGI